MSPLNLLADQVGSAWRGLPAAALVGMHIGIWRTRGSEIILILILFGYTLGSRSYIYIGPFRCKEKIKVDF